MVIESPLCFCNGPSYYDLTLCPLVAAPCVFGSFWLRALTTLELTDVLDFLSSYVQSLPSETLLTLLSDCKMPLKCYSVPLMHLLVF